MKKILIVWIVIALLSVTALSSCSISGVKTYEKEFVLTTPDDLHDLLLEKIDLTYRDLNLTGEELEVVKKYNKYGNVLRAAVYQWPGKSEIVKYNNINYDMGVDQFELEAISKILGINIEIEPMRLNAAIDLLEAGQIDLIPGIYESSRLNDKGLLLNHGTVTDFIYAYSIDGAQIENINDFDGKTIGVVRDFNIMSSDVIQSLENANIDFVLLDNEITEIVALQDLKNEDIDILLQTFSVNLVLNQCDSVNVSQIFDEYGSNILFTRLNDDIPLIMSVLEKLYSYSDYMQQLKQDYMDMFAAMMVSIGEVFTYDEQVFLREISKNPINILAINNSQPYIYYNNLSGVWEGISYEIWDAAAEAAQIKYNIIESEGDSHSVFESIKAGELPEDISIIMPMYNSVEKRDYLFFSEPLLLDRFVVVGIHDTEPLYEIYDMANMRIGVVDNFEATNALKSYLPHIEYYNNFTSNDELVNALLENTIDYIVLSETEFNEYFYVQHQYDLAIKYQISDAPSSIAFTDTESGRSLYSIYNKIIPFIKTGQIIEEFTAVDTDINEIMRTRNRDTLAMFILMFIVIIAFLGFFLRRLTRANKRVREIAFVNNITGLQNRTAFYNDNTLATGSLIYVDIDNFKRINEVYGHDIGDMYAFEIAQRISAIAAEFGLTAYTMDIDSFLLLDDGTNTEDRLVSISAKILYEVTKSVRIYDVEHKLTASIGIALKKDEKGMEELFKKVDTALFLAKERGKNRYVIASEDEFFIHRKQQFLNEQLTKETIQNEITPYYQPKIDIRDGRIIGLEALARWNSKEQGIIYPDEIIPVLKSNDMLPILDISILTKACKAYTEWLNKKIIDRSFIISCNMSYQTLETFDIVAAVMQIHDNIGMPYRSLEIEISESDFIENLDEMNTKLIELAKLGVNISIDQFKAERSIMTKMSKLPINIIKVDRSILKDGITNKVRELFELISTLTRRLNIGLIIQGVETAEEIQLLKEIPIYRVQGFYYSEAVPKSTIENDLRVKYIYR